jgi:hypothetical protein
VTCYESCWVRCRRSRKWTRRAAVGPLCWERRPLTGGVVVGCALLRRCWHRPGPQRTLLVVQLGTGRCALRLPRASHPTQLQGTSRRRGSPSHCAARARPTRATERHRCCCKPPGQVVETVARTFSSRPLSVVGLVVTEGPAAAAPLLLAAGGFALAFPLALACAAPPRCAFIVSALSAPTQESCLTLMRRRCTAEASHTHGWGVGTRSL